MEERRENERGAQIAERGFRNETGTGKRRILISKPGNQETRRTKNFGMRNSECGTTRLKTENRKSGTGIISD
jgi:hypothetical protein